MGCDVSDVALDGAAIERWDEIPAPSADLDGAYRMIGERVAALVEEGACAG